jgi:maleylacetate reductase
MTPAALPESSSQPTADILNGNLAFKITSITPQERMLNFTYESLPGRVVFGNGTRHQLTCEIERLGCSRAFLLSTAGHESQARSLGKESKLVAGFFPQAVMHTPVPISERAVEMVQTLKADCVVAFGGGSAIGLAKAIALRTDLPQVVIPTTYAGSEMTPILGETSGGQKTTQRTQKVLPEVVLYDPEATLTLPVPISVTSGMNAIAHSVEALYAQNRNPVISLVAFESIRCLVRSLPLITKEPNNLSAREEALRGAWLAGTALGAVGMSLHHKLCHVLGGSFDLPHAETHTVILPHAVAYNSGAEPAIMRSIAELIGSPEAAQGLFEFVKPLGPRQSLRELGMPEEGIEKAADLAVKNPYWNPRQLEREPIRETIRRAWAGEPPDSSI